jgi:hypothetical protein
MNARNAGNPGSGRNPHGARHLKSALDADTGAYERVPGRRLAITGIGLLAASGAVGTFLAAVSMTAAPAPDGGASVGMDAAAPPSAMTTLTDPTGAGSPDAPATVGATARQLTLDPHPPAATLPTASPAAPAPTRSAPPPESPPETWDADGDATDSGDSPDDEDSCRRCEDPEDPDDLTLDPSPTASPSPEEVGR